MPCFLDVFEAKIFFLIPLALYADRRIMRACEGQVVLSISPTEGVGVGPARAGRIKMAKTPIREVIEVSEDGVSISDHGKVTVLPWGALREAARQADPELAAAYAPLLAQALAAAATQKSIAIHITNRTNTPHGYAAELYDVAGEFVTGRTIAADWGQAMNYSQAKEEAEYARTRLASRGYEVRLID
jgi:hypothetical protein